MIKKQLIKTIQYGFILLALMIAATPASAQKIQQVDYEDLIDNLICDFTRFSLERQNIAKDLAAFEQETAGGKCEYFTIRQFLRARKPITTQTLEIINIIYNEYKEYYNSSATNQALYSNLTSLFDEEKVLDFGAKYPSAYPGFKTDLDGYMREVLNLNYEPEIDTVITLDEPKISDADSEEALEKEKDKRNPVDNNSKSSNYLMFLGFLILFLAIIAYLLYDYWKRNPHGFKQPAWMVYKGTSDKYQDQIDALNNKMQEQLMRQNEQQSEIEAISQSLDYLNRKLDLLSAPKTGFEDEAEIVVTNDLPTDDNIEIGGDINNDDIPNDEVTFDEDGNIVFPDDIPDLSDVTFNFTTPEVFFMPAPNADATFEVEHLQSEFISTESVYRFELLNNNEASFTFYNDPSTVKRALNGFDIYIKPVCKGLSAFDINASKIVTQVPGKVKKEGNVWKLTEKALIYFEQ